MRKVGAVGVLTLRKHSGDEMELINHSVD